MDIVVYALLSKKINEGEGRLAHDIEELSERERTDILDANARIKRVLNDIAPEYDDTKTYTRASLVVHEDKLWNCIQTIATPEAFNPAKWQEVTLDDILQVKADLVNGKVPSTQLPSYVSTIVEVATYDALPQPGAADTIYVTLDTGYSYRWSGTQYIEVSDASKYYSVPVNNMANMGALRTYINGVNAQGLHCFFDFSDYIENAYVCTVLMFSENSKNYCLIFDIINGRTFINYNGYNDADTLQQYCARNEDDLIRAMRLTDPTITLGQISEILANVNSIGHHVMFDVSALNAGAYLCTIFINNSEVKVFDLVSQTFVTKPYNANMTLVSLLGMLSSVATEEILRLYPSPITNEQYLHLKNDGYYCNWSTVNGHWKMTVGQDPIGTYSFPYDSSILYTITDDPTFQKMLEDCSEATAYVESQVFVTPEQYAELERQGLVDPDKTYYIQSNDLYTELSETIPEAEEVREENEVKRQDALREFLRSNPHPITSAEYTNIKDNGYYCNWSYAADTWTMTVASSASGIYSFPYQADVIYNLTDAYDMSQVEADITALQTAVAGKMDSILGWSATNSAVSYTGDFTAKTLTQTEANAVFNFTYQPHSDGTITDVYSRGEVVNNIMYLIGNFTFTASGSASLTLLGQLDMVLPTAVASAVWDFVGNNAASALLSEAIITSIPCIACYSADADQGASNYVDCICEIANATTANKISIRVWPKTTLSVSANDEVHVMFRVPLTLI